VWAWIAFRLYSRGKVVSFKRGKRTQTNHTVLVQLEGVRTAASTEFYLGKRLAYVYRAPKAIDGSHIRVIWGKVMLDAGSLGGALEAAAARGAGRPRCQRTDALNERVRGRLLDGWATVVLCR
jgi:large subunit ribosomal protein L35Ae